MAKSNLPSQVEIPTSKPLPIIANLHYHGILPRKKGKWASEIYNWRDSKIIYLGAYSKPEMAAIAYDVAALAFNKDKAVFNFPDAIQSHPVPKSNSIVDIQVAAVLAAEQFGARLEVMDASKVDSTPPFKVQIPASNTEPSVPPSRYRGVYCCKGRWVAKVCKSRKTIHIGTYSTAEMAAIAYDVAVLTIRGDNEVFNFPDIIRSHPVPKSNSIADIRAAAVAAASHFSVRPEPMDTFEPMDTSEVPPLETCEYFDEEELFNMPQILLEMAEGLMVSPPRFGPPYSTQC